MSSKSFLALAAIVSLAACSGDPKPADGGLSQDLALANQVQQPATPTFQDTAIAPKPVEKPRAPQPPARNPTVRPAPSPARSPAPQPATAPTPAPTVQPAPEPVVTTPVNSGGSAPSAKEVGAGTALAVSMGARVCTNANHPGDKLVASLSNAVMGTNGAIIPAGSAVVLEVASVTPGDRPDNASITFRVRAIQIGANSYDVTGDVTPLGAYEQEKIPAAPGADKKKVIGGAIVGAIAGRVLGGSTKGAVIGAAAGAAGGAVVAKAGQKYEACLVEGTPMKVVLAQKITLSS